MPPNEESIPPCPQCGSAERVIPVRYGKPTTQALAAARRGECELGGCSITADAPRWVCRACGHAFGDHADAFGRIFPGVVRPGGSA